MKENYDCLADVRRIRKRITEKYAHDPEAFFKHMDEVAGKYLDMYYPGELRKGLTIKGRDV